MIKVARKFCYRGLCFNNFLPIVVSSSWKDIRTISIPPVLILITALNSCSAL